MTTQNGIKMMQLPNKFWGPDIISVQPLSKPTMKLLYLDYVYVDKLKERRQKIEKLYERIRLKQNSDADNTTTEFLEYNKRD